MIFAVLGAGISFGALIAGATGAVVLVKTALETWAMFEARWKRSE